MVDEDYHAWVEYPEHRWVFNKLEMALRFGYDAGPACVPITKSGKYIIEWDGSSFPSGIYFYLVNTGKFFQTEKIILLK